MVTTLSNYTKTTNFTIKDSLASGDPAKVIKGADFDTEFVAIASAITTKWDTPTSTAAVQLPAGTTAQRPTPSTGMFRYNTTDGAFEGYDGTSWGSVGGASGAGGNPFMYENDTTVTADYTLTTGKNGMSAGPITIADGVSVTIPTGSVWTIV